MLRILPKTLGQSSKAARKLPVNWPKRAILEWTKLNFLAKPYHDTEFHHKLGNLKAFSEDLREKAQQRYLGVMKWCRNYIPTKVEKINFFHKLPKGETPVIIKSEIKEIFDSKNKAFSDACETAILQPFPGKQRILMQASEALILPSRLCVTLTRKYNRSGKCTPTRPLDWKISGPYNSKGQPTE